MEVEQLAEYRIEHFTKSFAIGGRRLEVLRGLDLSGDTGEITVILGRSGCGKTTLLKLLCGLEQPDEGSFTLADGAVKVGVVFQEPRLMPWRTCRQNITFGLKKAQVVPAEIDRLIEMVGLTGFEEAHPAQLSGGMQHRVALARALACRPDLVLMDEPFAALDYFTRDTLQRQLLEIHRQTSMGVILVTHNIDEAILLGDRICVMAGGKISGQWHPGPQEGERDLLSGPSIALKREILAGLKHLE